MNPSFQFYIPSFSGKAGKVFTWNGRKGLPSRGISSLSSELTLTSTWDSEMEDVNWSMSARCSWSSSSRKNQRKSYTDCTNPGKNRKGHRWFEPSWCRAAILFWVARISYLLCFQVSAGILSKGTGWKNMLIRAQRFDVARGFGKKGLKSYKTGTHCIFMDLFSSAFEGELCYSNCCWLFSRRQWSS